MRKNFKWNLVILGLMVVSGFALYYTNIMRVKYGFWDNGLWIFYNNFAYVVFFGLITGFVISNLISRANGRK